MSEPTKRRPTLSELGLDDDMPKNPLGRALDGYEAKPEEFESTWVDRAARPESPSFHPGLAAVLSFVIPGAGQIYRQRVLTGFGWLLVVVACYVLFWPLGLAVHLACVVMATMR